MSHARLHAPTEDGAILADSPLDEAPRIVAENQTRFTGWSHDFQGRTTDRIRAMTRAAVLAAAREYSGFDPRTSTLILPPSNNPQPSTFNPQPLIVSGHQPELFHPGVWLKNFAAHAIARRAGGVPLHLIVDTDTVKQTTVRVPTGGRTSLSVVHVPLDRWRGEIPFEEYEVGDEAAFASFGDRVRDAMAPLGVRPLAEEFWPRAVAARDTTNLSERISRARREQEAAWRCRSLELPISRLCQTESFFWFASHVLAQLDRFAAVYNGALDEYRRAHRIRSRNHPVPSLGRDGDWRETPFRVWTSQRPRRRALFVRQLGCEMELTDRDGWTARLPLAPDREACCAVEVLADLTRRGIKLRTRALTTTIFTRLCLADVFIHGLGGAIYDEVADEVIRRFFNFEPPQFLTLTGTLHLPIEPHTGASDESRRLVRLRRDLNFNPDRHLNVEDRARPELAALIQEKWQLIRNRAASRRERHDRFNRIRQLNGTLSIAVADRAAETDERLRTLAAELDANAILECRDWAFCVYPEDRLREFLWPIIG